MHFDSFASLAGVSAQSSEISQVSSTDQAVSRLNAAARWIATDEQSVSRLKRIRAVWRINGTRWLARKVMQRLADKAHRRGPSVARSSLESSQGPRA